MNHSPLVVVVSLILLTVGCDAPVKQFDANEVYALTLVHSRSTPTEIAKHDAAVVVQEMFGTPDQPSWPTAILDNHSIRNLVDATRLQQAAGPVSSEKDGTHLGLFREHCVTCHGLSGSGTGPASSVQNPYPRDFRHGVFKWKSTARASKPTRDDLLQILQRGVPGTGMPSFMLLESDDLRSLVDYTTYLSIRGEVERRLIAGAVDVLGYDDSTPEEEIRLSTSSDTEGGEFVGDVVNRVAEDWAAAEDQVSTVPSWEPLQGASLADSVERGGEIFHGPIANCVGCHGPAGNGQAILLDYDDWSKEYSTRLGLTPDDREAMRPFRDAGALRPRPIQARDLQSGVFRGGGDAESLYRRITQGIAGTPMPGVMLVPEPDGKGLTEQQIWDLVRYLQSLGNAS